MYRPGKALSSGHHSLGWTWALAHAPDLGWTVSGLAWVWPPPLPSPFIAPLVVCMSTTGLLSSPGGNGNGGSGGQAGVCMLVELNWTGLSPPSHRAHGLEVPIWSCGPYPCPCLWCLNSLINYLGLGNPVDDSARIQKHLSTQSHSSSTGGVHFSLIPGCFGLLERSPFNEKETYL